MQSNFRARRNLDEETGSTDQDDLPRSVSPPQSYYGLRLLVSRQWRAEVTGETAVGMPDTKGAPSAAGVPKTAGGGVETAQLHGERSREGRRKGLEAKVSGQGLVSLESAFYDRTRGIVLA